MSAEVSLSPRRTSQWVWRLRLMSRSPWLPVLVGFACLIAGAATYVVMTRQLEDETNSPLLYGLFILDLILILGMITLVARNIVRLVIERRRGAAGSRLHSRIAFLFGIVAIVPCILVASFSVLFFNLGVQSWFSSRVQTALEESQNVAAAYVREHQRTIRADAIGMADVMRTELVLASMAPEEMVDFLNLQVDIRGLSEAIVFDETGSILAQASLSFGIVIDGLPFAALQEAQRGDVVLLDAEDQGRIRALIQVDPARSVYLYIGRLIDAEVLAQAARVADATEQFFRLEGARVGFERTFALYYLVVSLVLLLLALWLGLQVANRLVRPVSGLVGAAEKVGAGDLDVRVRELADDDEMATLSRAFNRMTERLQTQQRELIEANQLLDRRRRFTEAVLDSATAGILRVDHRDTVTLSNRTAVDMLSWDGRDVIGHTFNLVAPEMTAQMTQARHKPGETIEAQLEVIRQARRRTLLVHMFAEVSDTTPQQADIADQVPQGVVVTFDDITDLLSAQRTAAWADVARRIAHEIKNPLTPIQLSADRLKRKYSKQVVDDLEIFEGCIDTIKRQVHSIGNLIDEFSSFARMPAPKLAREDVVKVLREAMILYDRVDEATEITLNVPYNKIYVQCDARLIGQVMTNLLKNALEAIAERRQQEPDLQGLVKVHVDVTIGDAMQIAVIDNGIGLPKEQPGSLTEPYVTTKKKGTGLGLAIVQKIIEDHRGRFTISANDPDEDGSAHKGARTQFTLPFPEPDLTEMSAHADQQQQNQQQ